MNLASARTNMIKQQLRTWDVLDDAVLQLIESVAREQFVPSQYHNLAYADVSIPLANGQMMLSPKIEGHILQAVQIKHTDNVLEVGTGTGYLTTLIAKQAKYVTSVDIDVQMIKLADSHLKKLLISNVSFEQGYAEQDWPSEENYDVIILSGSVPNVPEKLKNRLSIGGRLFAIIGTTAAMVATLMTRASREQFISKPLFDTHVKALAQEQATDPFVF
ncbi:methyltransferase [Piscirickettsia salmonis]|uniref:Protein-L-isoaspartate O-methyltransferase n=2 Tax=Piscirickettsia salmonis TaxID=1238 RepID=A0A9Q6LKI2_PISSA|nr:protein-L-isoaspartate O-methyltransferase [Piscirickettsia salmonis]ALA24378.1 methyltransferase domain protein [Piscirickettsia salmonis]APS44747.1 methyltransferase [Piscirickettsia salmonis]APS48107.1 methyltransferase [Piscirickettsia salmonis]APS52063.1 methyltransferase [Piscirickettsia salmonis]APS55281.1 methyltransferase [Piscirickettsia salmonis]